MTDLNMSLWLAGGVVIVGVMIYNFWQEYKAKKTIELAFGAHQDDVLMKPRDSAQFASPASTPPSKTSFDATGMHLPSRQEPTLGNAHNNEPSVEDHGLEAVLTEVAPLPIDDFIDCIISMEFETATRGDKIMQEIQSFRRVGNKPVHFVGVNTDAAREVISHAGIYTHLVAGVQLATRAGALNELEYSELVTKLRQVADNLNAYPDIPDMKQVIKAGRELHAFISEHDAQLSVNVKAHGAPWGKSALVTALDKQGFDMVPNGRFAMPDGQGGALYTLSADSSESESVTTRITLLLDVPCVAPSRGGYSAMVSCAKSLALRLGGDLVDDGNVALDDTTLEHIQEQVELFYAAMEAADIRAGSSRAVRLFS